jgi:hypothetical protein
MRRVPFAIVLASSVAAAAPTPPTDACARKAFDELVAVQARAKALAAAGTVTMAEKLELAMGVPTGYVMQSPGNERFRDLFAATDVKKLASIVTDIANDLDAVLANGGAWRYRCEAYPQSHVTPKPLTKRELAKRRAIAKRTLAAYELADQCIVLQNRVLSWQGALPEGKRHVVTKALDRCYVELELARALCERDFKALEHDDLFAPYQASIAVSNLIELRRVHKMSADDITAVRSRVEPMLDALQPPLSSLAAPSRAALAATNPIVALHTLSGTLKQLYSPCEQLWMSESGCIVQPDSCRDKPN